MTSVKCILFLIAALLLNVHARANGPKLEWVKSMGSANGDEQGKHILIDSNKAVIVAGEFFNTVDFDPGTGITNMVAAGGMDIFISKYDASGMFLWSKQVGGLRNEYVAGIRQDNFGNLFVAGSFQGKVDFDPGPAKFDLTSFGPANDFILKLDHKGNFIWAKQLLANNVKTFNIDSLGNLLLGGNFGGTLDFDPGAGSFPVTANTDAQDLFILKLDPAGNFAWVQQFKNPGESQVQEFGLDSDASNNIYFAGCFTAKMNFNPNAPAMEHVSNGAEDAFILKLNAQGEFKWVTTFGADGNDKIFALAVDNEANVYSTGQFSGRVNFNPGGTVFDLDAAQSYLSGFVSKLDTDGNLIYAKNFEGGTSLGQSIALDAAKNVYVAGGFYDDVDFDPGAATYNISGGNLFTVKLDTSGNFCWATAYTGGNFFSIFSAIKVDIFKNVYTTGSFPGTVDFDPETSSFNVTSTGGWNIYVHKLSQNRESFNSITAASCGSYVLNNISYNESGTYYQLLTNHTGGDSTIELQLSIKNKTQVLDMLSCGPYRWKSGWLSKTGIYRDTLLLPGGCDSIVELHLRIKQVPVPKLGRDTTLCTGESIVLSPGNYSQYIWNDNSVSDHLPVKEPGVYWVKVTDSNACAATDSIIVIRTQACLPFYLPNAFTPNNDGLNDYFKPTINYAVADYSLTIYNRWGQVIFISNEPKRGWDGSSKVGTESPGAYVYMIHFKYKDLPHSYKGSFMLLR